MRMQQADHPAKVELQTTHLIDIVFQLLVFFVMTFKIVAPEGDFHVKMPLANSPERWQEDSPTLPLTIRMHAADDGSLAGVSFAQRDFGNDWDSLREHVMSYLGADRGPGSLQDTTEVELDCDYQLDYEHVISAITAVSGYIDTNDNVVKLVEKIKFAAPRPAPGG